MSACATAASPRSASAPDATAGQTIDATGLHVLPGLIDPHVHLRDPGDKAVETIPTGTQGRRARRPDGGVRHAEHHALDHRRRAAGLEAGLRRARVAWCDMGLYVGGTKTNIPSWRSWNSAAASARIKIFAGSSTGDLMVEDDEHLERVMRVRPPPHRLSQRGRVPAAGAQAAVQVGRSVLAATWTGATRNAPSSAPAG